MSIEPFDVHVDDTVLDDLRERLRRTRWPQDFNNEDWAYGANTAYLKSLCAYWAEDFDWRAQEAAINAWPNFRTRIDGIPIHFQHVRGKGPNPKPLILSHGWPWTFWDYHKLIPRLTDPGAHGGDPDASFDVVVPSLPGFGFSTPLTTPGINFWRTADLWVQLMERLGYPKFYAEGGDWGAFITTQLGHKYAERVPAIYLHFLMPLDSMVGPPPARKYFAGEAAMARQNREFFSDGSGYSAIQFTRPQTIAHAIHDSPAGLAAWLVEKRRAWSHCDGEVESRFTRDELCTTLMIYWATQSYGTSARYYYEMTHQPWSASHDRQPVVESAVGIGNFLNEIVHQPRAWAEDYYNLQHWTDFESGGHFAPMEEPDALAADIRRFFARY